MTMIITVNSPGMAFATPRPRFVARHQQEPAHRFAPRPRCKGITVRRITASPRRCTKEIQDERQQPSQLRAPRRAACEARTTSTSADPGIGRPSDSAMATILRAERLDAPARRPAAPAGPARDAPAAPAARSRNDCRANELPPIHRSASCRRIGGSSGGAFDGFPGTAPLRRARSAPDDSSGPHGNQPATIECLPFDRAGDTRAPTSSWRARVAPSARSWITVPATRRPEHDDRTVEEREESPTGPGGSAWIAVEDGVAAELALRLSPWAARVRSHPTARHAASSVRISAHGSRPAASRPAAPDSDQ